MDKEESHEAVLEVTPLEVLVGGGGVRPDVHELHDDPGLGLPDYVVPQPPVNAGLDLGLLHYDVSQPGQVQGCRRDES